MQNVNFYIDNSQFEYYNIIHNDRKADGEMIILALILMAAGALGLIALLADRLAALKKSGEDEYERYKKPLRRHMPCSRRK